MTNYFSNLTFRCYTSFQTKIRLMYFERYNSIELISLIKCKTNNFVILSIKKVIIMMKKKFFYVLNQLLIAFTC